MMSTAVFYLIWLTLVGCLVVAAPLAGAVAVAGGCAVLVRSLRTRHE